MIHGRKLRSKKLYRLLNIFFISVIILANLSGSFSPTKQIAQAAPPTPTGRGTMYRAPTDLSAKWAEWQKTNGIDEATYGSNPDNPVAPLGGSPMPYSGSPILGPVPLSQVAPQVSGTVCDAVPTANVKTFNVSAIDVKITINRFGDNDPLGMMYVLDENIGAVRAQENKLLPDRVSIGLRDDPIQPLVIRANVGECVVINFTNRLATGNASINVRGLSVAAREAGSNVGLNPDSTVPPGKSITYHWLIDAGRPELEGAYVFRSEGDLRRQVSHGLFGVINVEPAGSTYLNVITGQPLKSGWEAMIVDPIGKDFREDTILYHEFGDEQFNMRDAIGNSMPLNDFLGVYRPGSRALNYRSEPFFRRQELAEPVLGHHDESQSYGSYMFGDPATPFPRGYLGDPTKRRIVHPGSERFHGEHLHGGSIRWPFDPTVEPEFWGMGFNKFPPAQTLSQRLDVQTLGPTESYTEQMEGAAGGLQQGAGEFLFHCHFPHHYIGGMWAFWRVYDTLQTAQTTLPGEPVLAELPDRSSKTPAAVNSISLLGKSLPSGKILTDGPTSVTTRNIDEWIRSVLPPQGVPQGYDASVWDWARKDTANGPLYLREPETALVWVNYLSPTPGQRPEILFNPNNMRPTFPLLRPHLGKRPPFAPNRSGSPWLGEPDADHPDSLIPASAPRQNYTVVAVELPIEFNKKFNLVSKASALQVLDEDKEDIFAGRKPKEQLTIRANVRDGVDVTYYSEETDVSFLGFAKTNIHIHFVQFDTQASDGVISGMSYEQTVRPYQTEGAAGTGIRLTQAAAAGSNKLTVDNASTLQMNAFVGVGFGVATNKPGGFEFAQIISKTGNTLTLDRPLTKDHPAGQFAGTEFVRYQWYADVEEGTTFFHDHVFGVPGFGKALTGSLIVEPEGSQWLDPKTFQPVRSGTQAVIRTNRQVAPGVVIQDFREFVLHQMGSITDLKGQLTSRGEPGGFNMKVEPLTKRLGVNPDPSLVFSSVAHGDPETPLLRAYNGDLVAIRLINSSGHDMQSFHVAGHRFRLERFDPREAAKSALSLGIAERFDLFFTGGSTGLQAGDYVYMSGMQEKMMDGAWGILRVHDTLQPDLLPLPNRSPNVNVTLAPMGSSPQPAMTGGRPPKANDVGPMMMADMKVRIFNVVAIETPIQFGKTISLQTGRAFVLAEDEADVRAGRKPSLPLVLRANVGDTVKINFTNKLLNSRASFHVPEMDKKADSQGAAFGFNRDSTVGPGETITQWLMISARFEVPRSIPVFDFGDPINGPASGLFGMFIIEPEGSSFHDPRTGEPVNSGMVVDVRNANLPGGGFKDVALIFYDNDPIMNRDVMPYTRDVTGVRGINLRAEPFVERLAENKDMSLVFKTGSGHADPRTPIIEAKVGEQIRVHVMGGPGQQPHVFSVDGHRFPFDISRPHNSHFASRQFGPFVTIDAVLDGGAGGTIHATGDYMYGDQRIPFMEAGLWGIIRVGAPAAFVATGITSATTVGVLKALNTAARSDTTIVPEGLPAKAGVEREIQGVVTGIDTAKAEWRIGNPPVTVNISAGTRIDPAVQNGDLVKVMAHRTLAVGPLVANEIVLLEARAEKVDRPVVTESFYLTGTVEVIDAHTWKVAGTNFMIDDPAKPAAIEAGLGVGKEVTVEFVAPGGGVSPIVAAVKAQTTVSASPENEVRFVDTVNSIRGQEWMVGNRKTVVDTVTRLIDVPREGNLVEIRAILQTDGSFLAGEIRNLEKKSKVESTLRKIGGHEVVKSATVTVGGESFKVDFTELKLSDKVNAIVTLPDGRRVSLGANWKGFTLNQVLAIAMDTRDVIAQAVALAAAAKATPALASPAPGAATQGTPVTPADSGGSGGGSGGSGSDSGGGGGQGSSR